ncbi:P-loop containing nucleoside triphosphatehydrolases superfamily protein [Striga asiatica]|uniref:P-loop containing nucleoside triphosphatehydrolases superfamily protein n=1 Tax=Striga asiatica TaxID=4170 RepID=A0A5A7PXG3_STRAF|nr:P-loop containing nucleoside triphosphatehydrolases superfamily protein [Striga asiatica]
MVVANLFLICLSIAGLILLFRLFLHRTALIFTVRKWADWVEDRVHVHQHFRVPELADSTRRPNLFYRRVSLYLNSLPSLEDSDFANLFSGNNANDIVLALDHDHPIHDLFLGARVSWVNQTQTDDRGRVVTRSFVLRIKKKDKRRILRPYLQHIHAVSDDIEQRGRELRVYSNAGGGNWTSAPFNHPSDFDTLVMNTDVKAKIRADLETFLKSKQYYHKLGRVWRRSYLLYGPSGTGKSSFIAAAANLLGYDVYNFNLSQVADESDLNALLLGTTSRSLIVVEDLDRYVSAGKSTGAAGITPSGLLNFMDGLLNVQDERVMIFTMSDKDGVDPDLLRPGRVDMHIHFPNCDFNSFRNLATNYLGVKEHKLFPQVEEIFQAGATMSPAEISELMLVNRSSPSRALRSVISALQSNGRTAARPSDGSSTAPPPPSTSEDGGSGAWKDAVMPKEIRKLYGMLRMKSCKKAEPFDHDSDIIQR